MQVELTSTTKIVQLNGVPARVWEGKTKSGIPVHAFITRISVEADEDTSEFEKELQEHGAPSPEVEAYSARLII